MKNSNFSLTMTSILGLEIIIIEYEFLQNYINIVDTQYTFVVTGNK